MNDLCLRALTIRRDASQVLTHDQRVDVFRAFVGKHGFEVDHSSAYVVFVVDSVGAHEFAAGACDFDGFSAVVHFGEGDVDGFYLVFRF